MKINKRFKLSRNLNIYRDMKERKMKIWQIAHKYKITSTRLYAIFNQVEKLDKEFINLQKNL